MSGDSRQPEEAEGVARASSAFNSAPDAIVTFDACGKILEFNPAAEEAFGCRRDQALGQDFVGLILPVTLPSKLREAFEELFSSGNSPILGIQFETRGLLGDGTDFPVELTISRLNTFEPPLFTAYIRDVTEQANVHEALQRNQRALAALLSNLPGMAYRCREADHLTMEFVSEGCLELTGYEAEDLLAGPGLTYLHLIHPDDCETVKAGLRRAVESQSPVELVYRIRTASGEEKWVSERAHCLFSVFSSEGELLGLEGFISDVTETKHAEDVLKDYNRRLEEDVANRTKEIYEKNSALEETLSKLEKTQDQLIMQAKMASLGALTAGIAHEIKNPLNFVNNFAVLSVDRAMELRQELSSRRKSFETELYANIMDLVDDLTQNAEKIHTHGKRADSIMRSMLEHSRAKPGERRMTDLNALLEEDMMLAYHGRRARDPSFNVTIEREFDPAVGEMNIEAQELGRVFLNIIDNGCHAALEKQKTASKDFAPTIKVQTRNFKDTVEIRIRDNGTGITREIRDDIFTPFFTTKPAGSGTGLGLSISYDIITQDHRGKVEVETEVGEYTEFIITLPKGG